ncbi:hypothetical protein BaRGS_00012631 [Batillaria attramentaria]|uniref:Secreted protein n=1 Tax=Batillaria attramentaria TaxID=370345 RepID=A0ABD0LAB8_9CAEN
MRRRRHSWGEFGLAAIVCIGARMFARNAGPWRTIIRGQSRSLTHQASITIAKGGNYSKENNSSRALFSECPAVALRKVKPARKEGVDGGKICPVC